ncbi:hypothetical protein DXG03_003933 [Asterophora parasitica]|uniref:Uncharacterized protein n=1 Tax=Asterophora parasitica TaxID=117018 RepID=A0A9P7G369_9AGAR|nr:hypothetical protein DXG03_003933 [Asterophora parasitica]
MSGTHDILVAERATAERERKQREAQLGEGEGQGQDSEQVQAGGLGQQQPSHVPLEESMMDKEKFKGASSTQATAGSTLGGSAASTEVPRGMKQNQSKGRTGQMPGSDPF